jgi:hypothetical protein
MGADRLVDVMDLLGLVGPSWAAWRALAKALDGLPLTDVESAIYETATRRTALPTEPPSEVWIVCGRRAGKSRFAAAAAVRAMLRAYPLAPGETAICGVAAADRDQARVLLEYVAAPFREAPALRTLVAPTSAWAALRRLVARETRSSVDLSTGVSAEVRAGHFGRIRGRTFCHCSLDELGFWPDDETGSNPASEVVTAVRPALATLGGQLVVTTSPFTKRGVVWETFNRFFGRDDAGRILVWRAPSLLMNPSLDPRVVEAALEHDEAAARAEWLAEWRDDVGSLLASDRLARVIVAGRTEPLPRLPDTDYLGVVDVATGSGADEFAWAVVHGEQEPDGPVIFVVDLVESVRPPFDPVDVARQCVASLRPYGVESVHGDRFAQGWVASSFERLGVAYTPSPLTRSDAYVEFLALVNSGRVELPDDARLVRQLLALQRRPTATGRERVDHPVHQHDDRANVTALACALAAREAAVPEPRLTVLGGW